MRSAWKRIWLAECNGRSAVPDCHYVMFEESWGPDYVLMESRADELRQARADRAALVRHAIAADERCGWDRLERHAGGRLCGHGPRCRSCVEADYVTIFTVPETDGSKTSRICAW